MENNQLINIHILPGVKNPEFEQRESGVTHTSYAEETMFYTLIQNGDTENVKQYLGRYLQREIVVGHLSDSAVRQMQYWAVCCITLGIRYAIQGGLDEMTAFNLSDEFIMKIDSLNSPDDINRFIGEGVLTLTELVKKAAHAKAPAPVRKCLKYIDSHLHEQIRLCDLSKETGFSEDYTSRIFKKYVGVSLREYILTKRLETAKAMISESCDEKMIAYYLGFCSQTYFITMFKKKYGVTPHKYAVEGKGGG